MSSLFVPTSVAILKLIVGISVYSTKDAFYMHLSHCTRVARAVSLHGHSLNRLYCEFYRAEFDTNFRAQCKKYYEYRVPPKRSAICYVL